jgi:hypothetical protein
MKIFYAMHFCDYCQSLTPFETRELVANAYITCTLCLHTEIKPLTGVC